MFNQPFLINSQHIQLIYENCDLDLEDILQHVSFFFDQIPKIILISYIITFDKKNIIVFLTLNSRFYICQKSLFDIDFGDKLYQLKIKAFCSTKYILQHIKTNIYITNIEDEKKL